MCLYMYTYICDYISAHIYVLHAHTLVITEAPSPFDAVTSVITRVSIQHTIIHKYVIDTCVGSCIFVYCMCASPY